MVNAIGKEIDSSCREDAVISPFQFSTQTQSHPKGSKWTKRKKCQSWQHTCLAKKWTTLVRVRFGFAKFNLLQLNGAGKITSEARDSSDECKQIH